MPVFGHQNQHHQQGSGRKPYTRPQWTLQESHAIGNQLKRQLGPEFISTRPSAGGRVAYLEGWRAINLANDIFGFDGWCSEIMQVDTDFCDDLGNGRFSLGISVKVRITLKDGTFREDIGYGTMENTRSKSAAFDKAKKEATTDAMKRAFRQFGNAMGNCIYDASYRTRIARENKPPAHFKAEDLLRVEELVSARKEHGPGPGSVMTSSEIKSEGIPDNRSNTYSTARHAHSEPSQGSNARQGKSSHVEEDNKPYIEDFPPGICAGDFDMSDDYGAAGELEDDPDSDLLANVESTEMPAHFYSARAAEIVQANKSAPEGSQFNPGFVSPSFTPTIDQTKSAPIKRSDVAHLQSAREKTLPEQLLGAPRALQDIGRTIVNVPRTVPLNRGKVQPSEPENENSAAQTATSASNNT